MQQFMQKFRERIVGVLSGFDRLVFRGSLWRLNFGPWNEAMQAMVAVGMEQYLWQNQILFKDYVEHVKRASERLKKASLKPFEQHRLPVMFLRSPPGGQGRVGPARGRRERHPIGAGVRPQHAGTKSDV